MAEQNSNNQEATITLTAGQTMRGLLFAFAVIGGANVPNFINAAGANSQANSPEFQKLVDKVQALEKKVDKLIWIQESKQ